MTSKLGRCSTDSTGTIVTQMSGVQFAPSWVGLQMVINGFLLPNGTAPTITAVSADCTQLTMSQSVGQNLSRVPFAPNRETVYQAFFNLLKLKLPGVAAFSRVPQSFDNLPVDIATPFVFVEQVGEEQTINSKGMPYHWHLNLAIGIFCVSPDPTQIVPASLLNPILDGLERAIPPSPVVAQTLDGLVDQARLFGPEHNAAGAIAEKAWAYCPAFISAT